MEATFDKRNRIDLLDLKDQREGEAHIFFKSTIVRAKFFHANPAKIKKIKLNQMVKVRPPTDQAISSLRTLSTATFNAEMLDLGTEPQALDELFNVLNQPAVKKDNGQMVQAIIKFIGGEQKEELIDFGDQSGNPSIFMHIPVEERLSSNLFDVEVSPLQPSILTKEKLYEVVKRLNILEGKSESLAKRESMEIIDKLEQQTDYSQCFPKKIGDLSSMINELIQQGA
jgi:intracellular multiplication protein IcmO